MVGLAFQKQCQSLSFMSHQCLSVSARRAAQLFLKTVISGAALHSVNFIPMADFSEREFSGVPARWNEGQYQFE